MAQTRATSTNQYLDLVQYRPVKKLGCLYSRSLSILQKDSNDCDKIGLSLPPITTTAAPPCGRSFAFKSCILTSQPSQTVQADCNVLQRRILEQFPRPCKIIRQKSRQKTSDSILPVPILEVGEQTRDEPQGYVDIGPTAQAVSEASSSRAPTNTASTPFGVGIAKNNLSLATFISITVYPSAGLWRGLRHHRVDFKRPRLS
ncbi:hypothetical protein BDP81DRAFT_57733 [Colletotrichum phormii]|uniref:Uncharacterized protein n=1 Tax=Colletotrichum phormii TaxID=359342 RepID=A0AAI9ZMF0_9PEZI|nr:uncharacterized protein BDP81DRAFT_57733 [Colletotrichum phormii]KAK1634350.1 hypothetical protein BDP81DRAFT_57733 [Colletotrichum phormii]